MRRAIYLVVPAVIVLFGVAPASAATFTYTEGQTVALGFNQLPSSYDVYWFSDLDGYLMSGNPLRTSSLSVGTHQVTYLIYRRSTQTLVYRGAVTVVIEAAIPSSGTTGSGGTPTSSGSYAPGEFEPVRELLLGTPDAYSVDDLYPAILDAIRGVAPTTIYVDNSYVRYDLEDIFVQAGVDDADYSYVTLPLDSIWMRDYGPLFTKKNGRLEIVDLKYYPGRPYDDAVPSRIGQQRGIGVRRVGLYWEGGNYTSDGSGNIFATTVLYDGNSGSASQIDSTAGAAFYARLNVFEPMANDGGTGHLDMFALLTGSRSLVLNRFPSGHANARLMDSHASRFENLGFQVTRIDLADRGFSSYTNGLIVNGVALVPWYGKSSTDNSALAAFRAAGYRAVGIDCRRIIQWGGAIHCITITVPR